MEFSFKIKEKQKSMKNTKKYLSKIKKYDIIIAQIIKIKWYEKEINKESNNLIRKQEN